MAGREAWHNKAGRAPYIAMLTLLSRGSGISVSLQVHRLDFNMYTLCLALSCHAPVVTLTHTCQPCWAWLGSADADIRRLVSIASWYRVKHH